MNADDELDDIWTIVPGSKRVEPASEPSLRVERIKGVRPLDSQFGINQPKTTPDALVELLFGQPYPKETEIATAVGDPDQLPHLETYAILDAAKVVNLPEMLETSDLEYRCLFKGAAYAEMKDVAPWIVRLEDGNTFTRNLFTRSDAPWHLWDVEPGLYLRSTGTLDDMWKHFRKFTKVQDEQGKWYYTRFYDPCGAVKLLDQTRFWSAMLYREFPVSAHFILDGNSIHIYAQTPFEGSNIGILDIARERDKELERKLKKNALMAISTMALSEEDTPIARKIAKDCMRRMIGYGFSNERHLRIFATWELTYGMRYEEYDPEGRLLSICRDASPALRRFKQFSKRMDQVNFKPRVS